MSTDILEKNIAHAPPGNPTPHKEAPTQEPTHQKNPSAVALGKLGGKKGGDARAKKLTSEQRKAIANTGWVE